MRTERVISYIKRAFQYVPSFIDEWAEIDEARDCTIRSVEVCGSLTSHITGENMKRPSVAEQIEESKELQESREFVESAGSIKLLLAASDVLRRHDHPIMADKLAELTALKAPTDLGPLLEPIEVYGKTYAALHEAANAIRAYVNSREAEAQQQRTLHIQAESALVTAEHELAAEREKCRVLEATQEILLTEIRDLRDLIRVYGHGDECEKSKERLTKAAAALRQSALVVPAEKSAAQEYDENVAEGVPGPATWKGPMTTTPLDDKPSATPASQDTTTIARQH